MTISGTYNPTNNSVALTVTDGPAGTLVVYVQSTVNVEDSPRVRVVDTVPGYTGGPTSVTDWLPANKSLTYHAYVDDVANGSTAVDVPASGFTGVWMMSLTDPTRRAQVKVARERRDSWRARDRRGWTGDVIGETRTVGVTDVAMSGRRGRFDVITETDTEHDLVDSILRAGIVCVRACSPGRYPAGYLLIDRMTDVPNVGPGGRYEVDWIHTWPAGYRDRLPDE